MLVDRWQHVLSDRSLHGLPYKIELNAWGKVEMTPASNRRGRLQGALAAQLGRQLQGMQAFGEMTPYGRAPEICVEIVSAATVDAEIAEKTAVRYLSASGELPRSRFPVTLVLPAPIKGQS